MAINTAPHPNQRPVAPGDTVPAVKWQSVWTKERIHTLVVLGIFILYGTFRAFENNYFDIPVMSAKGTYIPYSSSRNATGNEGEIVAQRARGSESATVQGEASRVASNAEPVSETDGAVPHLLSPFYSPPLHHLPFWPAWLSASLFLLAFPGSFRFTCYFCRRTYYRAIFGTPPSCAAKEVMKRSNYTGEREFPLYVQNLHRYTLYFIMVFVFFHWIHLAEALKFGEGKYGIGVGTLVCAVDTVLLTLYVGSCHSFRHLVGGLRNRFSGSKRTEREHKVWSGITKLNEKHGIFFWASLYSVGLFDLYVRSVASGAIPDLHVILIGK